MRTVASFITQCLFAACFGLAIIFVVVPFVSWLLGALWSWIIVPVFQIAALILIGAVFLGVLSLFFGVDPMSDKQPA